MNDDTRLDCLDMEDGKPEPVGFAEEFRGELKKYIKNFTSSLEIDEELFATIGCKAITACDIINRLSAEAEAGRELWIEAQSGRKRLALENDKLQAENKRFKEYLEYIYEGDGNIEFDELWEVLKGEADE